MVLPPAPRFRGRERPFSRAKTGPQGLSVSERSGLLGGAVAEATEEVKSLARLRQSLSQWSAVHFDGGDSFCPLPALASWTLPAPPSPPQQEPLLHCGLGTSAGSSPQRLEGFRGGETQTQEEDRGEACHGFYLSQVHAKTQEVLKAAQALLESSKTHSSDSTRNKFSESPAAKNEPEPSQRHEDGIEAQSLQVAEAVRSCGSLAAGSDGESLSDEWHQDYLKNVRARTRQMMEAAAETFAVSRAAPPPPPPREEEKAEERRKQETLVTAPAAGRTQKQRLGTARTPASARTRTSPTRAPAAGCEKTRSQRALGEIRDPAEASDLIENSNSQGGSSLRKLEDMRAHTQELLSRLAQASKASASQRDAEAHREPGMESGAGISGRGLGIDGIPVLRDSRGSREISPGGAERISPGAKPFAPGRERSFSSRLFSDAEEGADEDFQEAPRSGRGSSPLRERRGGRERELPRGEAKLPGSHSLSHSASASAASFSTPQTWLANNRRRTEELLSRFRRASEAGLVRVA